eukprot:1760452-Prymnesium_polylepis.1
MERSSDRPRRWRSSPLYYVPIDHHPTRDATPARHREMPSRAHDSAKRNRRDRTVTRGAPRARSHRASTHALIA